MAELNLGKVRMTEAEIQELVKNYNGGMRLGTDENGNDGYYKYDEEEGADTFTPFKKSGGAGDGAVSSPYIHMVKFTGTLCNTVASTLYSYFPIKKVKGLTLKTMSLKIRDYTSSASHGYMYFEIYGVKDGSVKRITSYSASASGTSDKSVTKTDEVINLTGYDSIEYVKVGANAYSGSAYIYPFSVDAEFELAF